jgi:hypothetical protein
MKKEGWANYESPEWPEFNSNDAKDRRQDTETRAKVDAFLAAWRDFQAAELAKSEQAHALLEDLHRRFKRLLEKK